MLKVLIEIASIFVTSSEELDPLTEDSCQRLYLPTR